MRRRPSLFVQRNREIMKKVLNGETLQSVADAFELNHQRIHAITTRECRCANPTLYAKMNLTHRGHKLPWLRKRRARFLGPQVTISFAANDSVAHAAEMRPDLHPDQKQLPRIRKTRTKGAP